jgi:hypothetical protein
MSDITLTFEAAKEKYFAELQKLEQEAAAIGLTDQYVLDSIDGIKGYFELAPLPKTSEEEYQYGQDILIMAGGFLLSTESILDSAKRNEPEQKLLKSVSTLMQKIAETYQEMA